LREKRLPWRSSSIQCATSLEEKGTSEPGKREKEDRGERVWKKGESTSFPLSPPGIVDGEERKSPH